MTDAQAVPRTEAGQMMLDAIRSGTLLGDPLGYIFAIEAEAASLVPAPDLDVEWSGMVDLAQMTPAEREAFWRDRRVAARLRAAASPTAHSPSETLGGALEAILDTWRAPSEEAFRWLHKIVTGEEMCSDGEWAGAAHSAPPSEALREALEAWRAQIVDELGPGREVDHSLPERTQAQIVAIDNTLRGVLSRIDSILAASDRDASPATPDARQEDQP